jgi:hypothetical protein
MERMPCRRTQEAETSHHQGRFDSIRHNMSFGLGRLHGTFDLTTAVQAEEMIRAIETMKALLKPSDDEAAN